MHPAVERDLETLFGPVTLRRNYYHAAGTGQGRYPLDEALKLVGPCWITMNLHRSHDHRPDLTATPSNLRSPRSGFVILPDP